MQFRSSLVVLVAVLWSAPARAHDVRGTIVFLDVGERAVEAELQLPLTQLELALERPVAHGLAPLDGNEAEALMGYVREHLHARTRGAPMSVAVRSAEIARIDDGDALVVRATLTAPDGESARWLELAYDGIVHRVANHNIFVLVRRDLRSGLVEGRPELVGLLHYQKAALVIDRTGGSAWRGLWTLFRLGVRHIAAGADHLLFLLMLLLPAPLQARWRRWREPATVRRCLAATVKIVTAFTVGHSLTLVLAALRGAALPERPVEVLIACSVLISAVHALRPLFAGKEALIAGGFGLVHGLAFASALTGLGVDRPSLALGVLGFNLGVEAMQLALVAATLPWLLLCRGRPIYRHLRVAGASVGALVAAAWIVQRALA